MTMLAFVAALKIRSFFFFYICFQWMLLFVLLQVVMDFKMPGKVYGMAMSAIATTHMLIAAGSEDVQVRLCDIASGAFTHTLSGHRGKIS